METVRLDGAAAVSAEGSETQIRIVSYNIAHGRGLAESNWEGGTADVRIDRLDDIAALLRDFDADVVVLNEVDFDSSWSQSVDQATYLAREAGYRYCVKLRNMDFCVGVWSWRFGNAVLSRYPIADAKEIELPGYAKWETVLAGQKRALFCEIEIGDMKLGIAAAHLSHRSEDLRVASAKQLLAFSEGYGRPLVIAGDLNSTPSGFSGSISSSAGVNAMDVFDQSGLFLRLPTHETGDRSENTFRSDRPVRIIDWILVPKPWQVRSYFADPSELSDHRPVIADVVLGELSSGQ